MLTERIIRDAKPEAVQRVLWDSQIKGLGVRVTVAGMKSFVIDYRTGGRQRRATIRAMFGDVTEGGPRAGGSRAGENPGG